jgi:hypothetical protein
MACPRHAGAHDENPTRILLPRAADCLYFIAVRARGGNARLGEHDTHHQQLRRRRIGRTIVFNKGGAISVGGLAIGGPHLTLRSSIVADNQGSSGAKDLFFNGTVVSGEANLVMFTNANPASAGITLSSEPRLTPLANHGGPTLTHALLASSPAIAAGSNPAVYPYDQRGPGFDRTLSIPPPAALTWTDIGAYQRQLVDDEIFYDGFAPLPGA